MHVCDVLLILVFYVLLRPVNKNLALLAVLFNLIQTAVLLANKLNVLMPLVLLGNADYLKAFESNQLYPLTYLFIKVHDYGFGFGLIFFGFACLIYAYLLFRSGYFPRTLGVLMMIAGLSYLTNSFTLILAPAYAGTIFPILVLALIGELSLCLWLMVKGWSSQSGKNVFLNLPDGTYAERLGASFSSHSPADNFQVLQTY